MDTVRLALRVFLFAFVAFALSAWAADDPFTGIWKMNLAKSKYSPGPPPKAITYNFQPAGANGVKLIADNIDSKGNPNRREFTATYDGKEYPVTGNPDADSVSLKRIDAYHVEGTQKKNGTLVRTFQRVVSPDGKTLTVTEKLTTASGKVENNVIVYDKQ
jgi:hypothetical protein